VIGDDLPKHKIGLYVHKGYIILIPMILRILDLRILGILYGIEVRTRTTLIMQPWRLGLICTEIVA
jgi:hypothetical protein